MLINVEPPVIPVDKKHNYEFLHCFPNFYYYYHHYYFHLKLSNLMNKCTQAGELKLGFRKIVYREEHFISNSGKSSLRKKSNDLSLKV